MPVAHVNDLAAFNAKLEEAKDQLVVVDFFAEWCGPCKRIAPFLESKSDELAGEVLFIKVDVDEAEDVAQKYEISAMPTFKLFKNSKSVEDLIGADQGKLEALISKHK